ncbi:MAG: PilZ domain-containing protein [Oscillibacter sp.]|nr:PilZ domain-containing protein [Oscillibacter sp.]
MSFFKSWFKREEPAAFEPLPNDFPELYSGMKAEVLTPANALIFVGRVRLLSGNQIDVLGEAGGFLPRALYNQPVKLRCFPKEGDTFTLNGTVGPNDPTFWRIEHLQYLYNIENRNFFRQNTGAEGQIRSVSGQKHACKILDIGGGGARVLTEKLLQLESTFQLETSLLSTEEPFTFTCQVKRVTVRAQTASPMKKYEYGCQFVDLPLKEQERLLQAIFTLQRKVLQARREK